MKARGTAQDAMSKGQRQMWPYNGRPSSRHVWKHTGYAKEGGGHDRHIVHCERCGSNHSPAWGGSAPIHCFPSPEWLRAHPEDDRKEGP
jgi:hypothetical protein